MKSIPTSDVLDVAADAIQMAGWGKGPSAWDLDNGRGLCIEGAIAAVIDVERFGGVPNDRVLRSCPAYRAVQDYLDMRESEPLYLYNDILVSSQEEVIAVLRAAAAVERLKEQAAYETEDQPLPLGDVA